MKKGIVKRFLSVLLVLVMVVSVLPMTAMAAGFQSMTVSGKTVNVGFGTTLDPTTVLPGYDIKAVAAIKVGYDEEATTKLSAEGAVEMLIPKDVFDDVIEEKATSMVETHYDAKLAAALAETKSVTETVTKNVTAYVDIEYMGKVAHDVEITVSATVTHTLTDTPTNIVAMLLDGQEYYIHVQQADTVNIRVKDYIDEIEGIPVPDDLYVDVSYSVDRDVPVVFKDVIDPVVALEKMAINVLGSYYSDLFDLIPVQSWAAATKDAYDAAAAEDKGAAITAQLEQLAAVYAAGYANNNSDEFKGISIELEDLYTYDYCYYKSAAEIRQAFIDKIIALADSVLGGNINSIYHDNLPAQFSLKQWFDAFIARVKNSASGLGLSEDMIPNLPTGQIADLEDMLKDIVAKLNGTTAASEILSRKIIGKDVADSLSSSNETGIYVVAGVDMNGTYAYEIYVIAPDIIDMRTAIEKNGADAGYVINHTYNGSAAPVGVNSAFVSEDLVVRYVGVETDGGTYNSEVAPTNAGVYTVFALSLNKETLRMGGDVAMLVIEPAETENFYFTEVDKVVTVPAGSTEEYFPNLVSNPYMNITVATNAADKNGENVAYVTLPENFADIVGVYTDHAGNLLTKIEADTALPMPNYLAGRVLGALANAAEKVGNGGSLTAAEFKTIVNDYLTVVEEWYDSEDVLDRAGDMVDKVKGALAENETVKQYLSLFESLQDSFENMPFHARAIGQVTYGVQANSEADKLGSAAGKFLDRFMEEADISKDDVRALLQSLLNSIENSSYMHDAETLVKTLCSIFRVDNATVTKALADVQDHFDDLKAGVKALDIDITDPKIADAEAVLALISDFIGDVKAVVEVAIVDVDLDVVYFGKNPSAPGKYNCYAVNIAANYVPTMATTTLEIKQQVEPELGIVESTAMEVSFDSALLLWTYFDIPEEMLNNDGIKVLVTKDYAWDGMVTNVITMAELREAGPTSYGDYRIEQSVASGEMAREVTVQFVDENGNYLTVKDYEDGSVDTEIVRKVADYAARIFERGTEKQKALVQAMLVYGGYSQKYFNVDAAEPIYDLLAEYGYDLPNLANITADSITEELTKSASGNGLTYSAQQAFLDYSIYHRVYFKLDAGEDISNFKFEVEMIDVPGNLYTETVTAVYDSRYDEYYVDIKDIPAAYLDHMYTVTATNLTTGVAYEVSTSVLVWAKTVMQVSSNVDQINLAKAVYHYNQAANTFFGK